MTNSDVTVISCTRCHVRAAVASGLCAECVESLQDENRRLRAFVEKVLNSDLEGDTGHMFDKWTVKIPVRDTPLGAEAAALLASMKPAEDSDGTN